MDPMATDEFVTQRPGIFYQPTPEEKRLRELAGEYHRVAEAYDRTVCTGRIIDGAIRPITSLERSLVNKHAIALKNRLYETEVQQLGCSRKDWQRAIASYVER